MKLIVVVVVAGGGKQVCFDPVYYTALIGVADSPLDCSHNLLFFTFSSPPPPPPQFPCVEITVRGAVEAAGADPAAKEQRPV